VGGRGVVGWSELEMKANSAQLKLEPGLGLSLAIRRKKDMNEGREQERTREGDTKFMI
jgi:hypothetical protein